MNNRQGSRRRPPPMAAAVATAVHRDSHAISKPMMISKPKIKIWHVLPPEIIHTDAANFRDLVQRLTGFQHTTTKSNPTTATASPPPPTSSSPHDHDEACSQGNTNNTPMAMAIKDDLKQEEEEQEQVERMFWMEESSLGFLRALEEDQNVHDHDHDQFFLHGFGDLHLLPFING